MVSEISWLTCSLPKFWRYHRPVFSSQILIGYILNENAYILRFSAKGSLRKVWFTLIKICEYGLKLWLHSHPTNCCPVLSRSVILLGSGQFRNGKWVQFEIAVCQIPMCVGIWICTCAFKKQIISVPIRSLHFQVLWVPVTDSQQIGSFIDFNSKETLCSIYTA